jgi:hypothetical protein
MRSVLLRTFLGLLLLCGGAAAAPPADGQESSKGKDEASKGTAADVSFTDGSTVRVTLVAANVEMETKYGKLTIPAADLRRIEFAFRISDDVAGKIAAAVKRLGDTRFEEREAATKELRALGLRAYPALEVAAKSADAEVARRASTLSAEVRERVAAEDLTFPKQDLVQTAEFTAVGRVTSRTLRVQTAYFGEADLKLADLRVFQEAGGTGARRLTVDAAKFGGPAEQWMETSVTLERGAPLKISASGQVDLWPAQPGGYMTSPKGYGNVRPGAFGGGSLVGKIGESGTPFMIGEKYEGKAAASGKLYLHITPSPWGNASTGTYDVRLSANER